MGTGKKLGKLGTIYYKPYEVKGEALQHVHSICREHESQRSEVISPWGRAWYFNTKCPSFLLHHKKVPVNPDARVTWKGQ